MIKIYKINRLNLLLILCSLFCLCTFPVFADPILHLQRLVDDKDFSLKHNIINIQENGVSKRVPDLNNKAISIKLKNGIPRHEITIAFKFIPDHINQSADLLKSEFLNISQSKDSIISVFSNNYGNKSYISNKGNGIKTKSCNLF